MLCAVHDSEDAHDMRRKLFPLLAILPALMTANAAADIRTTPHSLVKKSVKPDASDVCVFCHTPSISGKPPTHPPVWQRSIGTDLVFTIYDDIGRLGLGKDSVGSQSIACLSCHDSNQARAISKTSEDHPFGVPYQGSAKHRPQRLMPRQASDEDNAPAIHAKRLVATEDFRDASQGTVENHTVWWVSTTGITARRTRNDLPLYVRRDRESGGQPQPFIECGSCHDPHSNNDLFLRLPNDGSRLCLTCHTK